MSWLDWAKPAFTLLTSARPKPKPGSMLGSGVYRIPADWLDNAPMKRVVLHWTGGSYIASENDKEHYHFVIEGDLDVHRGHFPVRANASNIKLIKGKYAAHTRGTNTGAIGVSVCAMGGKDVKERPFVGGKFPVTRDQLQRAAEVVAHLCKHYKIPVTNKTVLSHAEVQTNLGIKQAGKWDISIFPWAPEFNTARRCGDEFREMVAEIMSENP